jgi:hypothetical protein
MKQEILLNTELQKDCKLPVLETTRNLRYVKPQKLDGYSQSPKPYTDDLSYQGLRNQKKQQLFQLKKNLESKLKNIVT